MGKKLNLGHLTLIKNWIVAHFISVTHDQTFTDTEKLKARENIGVEAIVGKLSDLTTTVKTSIVAAINSIAGSIIEGVVTGVKGDAETEYRKGDVNITKENIGLGNVDNTADMDKPMSTATKEYVDDAISTNSATYRGSVTAIDNSDEAALMALAAITTKDNNDYAHVEIPNYPAEGVTKVKRYKFVVDEGGTGAWSFEYALNNTGFTTEQLAVLNSGITSEGVAQIASNKDAIAAMAATVADVNNRLAAAEADVANVKEDITAMQATVDAIREDVVNLKASVDAIEPAIQELIAKDEAHDAQIADINTKFDADVSSDNQAQGKEYIDAGDEEATDAEVTAALNAE